MNNLKISIITVCYNSALHLEEAINSVISQPYDNKEYIIIDGGSTDDSLNIIAKYRDYISYFVSENDRGISDAFNKGIMAATGDIICICNSDDVLAYDIFNKFLKYYEDDIDIYRLDEKIKNFSSGEEFLLIPTMKFPRHMRNAQPCHMGCYITKEAFEKFGMYDVEMRYCMDMELLRRYTVLGALTKHVPEVCGYFRKGGASQTTNVRKAQECEIIIKRYGGNVWDICLIRFYSYIHKTLKRFLSLFGDDVATRLKSKIQK